VEPRPRREDLLLLLKDRKERPREVRGFHKNLRDDEYHEVRRSRVTAGKVPLENTATDNLTAYHTAYRFVITISFIVTSLRYHLLLQYRLSFRHYNIINHLVITVSLIVSSLRYRLLFWHCGIASITNFVVTVLPVEYNSAIMVPPSIVFCLCEFILYYIDNTFHYSDTILCCTVRSSYCSENARTLLYLIISVGYSLRIVTL